MTEIWLFAATPIVALLIWVTLRKRVRRSTILERSGVSYFKVLLRQRGIDVSRIPDAALSEIIRIKTIAAKKKATIAGLTKSDRAAKNWRIILVRSLEAEANLMISLIRNGPQAHPNSDATAALRKHGVFRSNKAAETSGMTAEQFLEAAQRGTLYSELHERQSRREPS